MLRLLFARCLCAPRFPRIAPRSALLRFLLHADCSALHSLRPCRSRIAPCSPL
jgi:hypothetical protein